MTRPFLFGEKRMTIPFYDEHGQAFFDRSIDANLNHLYDAFTKYLSDDAHILEVGCGSGRDAKAFIERGYRVTATDGSATMAKLAQEYLGQEVLHLTFDQIAFENEFDAIWANACLLHLPMAEMKSVFERLSKALKTGGVWYAGLKLGEGEIVAPDGRMFTFFNQETMRELVSHFPSLEIAEMTTSEDTRPDHKSEFWLNVYLRKL
jgi:SAM-dependent methyltransferase